MFAASKSGRPTPDPYFNSTVALLETTSTNGQQNNTFLDSSTNAITVTRTSAPTQGTFTPFSQTGWSGYFDGTTDYLTTPQNAAFNFGTGAFTVEAWVYLTAYPSGGATTIISLGSGAIGPSGPYSGWNFRLNPTGTIEWYRYDGTEYSYITSNVVPINQWTHVVAVRNSSSSLSLYVNGSRGVNATSSVAFNNVNSDSLYFGRWQSGLGIKYLTGYTSNARIVNGTAIYDPTQTTITVPTTPLTAVTNTSLLTLQSNYFKDNSSNNFALTVNGTTGTLQATAFSPFAPLLPYSTSTVGGSGYFNGTTDFLTTAANSALALGAGNWTIEFWMYKTISSNAYIIVNGADWGLSTGVSLISYLGNFALNVGGNQALSIGVPLIAQWAHIAIVQNSTTVTLYQNGTSLGTVTSSVNLTDNIFKVGMTGSWSPINGYISNLRVVKGTAVYTSAFTPPTLPLTAITNTSLLLSGTNSGIYDATSKNDISTISGAQASTTQSKFGGSSMLFNGTTDYLTAVDKPTLQLGTGDFTIEGWVYLTTGSTARGYISKGPTASTTGWEIRFNAANFFRFEWTASFVVGTTTIPTNTWTHVAVVRSGTATGNVKLYVNGALYATSSVAVTDNFNQTDPLRIGIDRAGAAFFPGYTEEIRITKGIARYTAAFTAPTAPFPVN